MSDDGTYKVGESQEQVRWKWGCEMERSGSGWRGGERGRWRKPIRVSSRPILLYGVLVWWPVIENKDS